MQTIENVAKPKTKAVEVSFLKKTKWAGTDSRMLTFPVRELADHCMDSWFNITDEKSACYALPSERLMKRFRELAESDASQDAWDGFYDEVRKELSAMSVDGLAALFRNLNDPSTIVSVLWSDGEYDFVDSDCEYRY
jgi:hypothetical protein